MGAIERRPAIKDTRCWDDRRRDRGDVGERGGRGGALILEKRNEEADGVRGLEEREGECGGESVRGSEKNRDVCFCMGRAEGVRIVVGYNVPELA